jgi:tRNA-specific 2-thiouridylase
MLVAPPSGDGGLLINFIMKKVVVGLSGGVDSSVAAYLLQQQGYEVIGLFMKNWHDDTVTISNECPWLEDSNDALLVAQKLGIPFQTVDLSEVYKTKIVDYMFEEYQNGRTPNPDVLCNREIKFDNFLDIALSLGADFVATGHYVQKEETIINGETIYQLKAGKDNNKDQSYFLCQVSQYQLSKSLFPIGNLTKPEVRAIAQELDLITADKKDSQGLCFIGKVRLPEFLQQKLAPKDGIIIQIDEDNSIYQKNEIAENDLQKTLESESKSIIYAPEMGKIVGKHTGAHFYTIGQRKGLNVGGTAFPLFIIATDVVNNIIYTGMGAEHPGLFKKSLQITNKDVHWIRQDLKLNNNQSMKAQVRIRYRQPLQNATLFQQENAMYIQFDELQSAITPGQFAAWYIDNELIGSGVINF